MLSQYDILVRKRKGFDRGAYGVEISARLSAQARAGSVRVRSSVRPDHQPAGHPAAMPERPPEDAGAPTSSRVSPSASVRVRVLRHCSLDASSITLPPSKSISLYHSGSRCGRTDSEPAVLRPTLNPDAPSLRSTCPPAAMRRRAGSSAHLRAERQLLRRSRVNRRRLTSTASAREPTRARRRSARRAR